MRFSQRKGIKSVKEIIQINSLDEETRVSLWNAFTNTLWRFVSQRGLDNFVKPYFEKLWDEFYNLPTDTIPHNLRDLYNIIREDFLKKMEWNEIFDFIEFTLENFADFYGKDKFISDCNNILERELSGYRIVGKRFIEDITEEQINEIEEVLESKKLGDPAKIHIQTAIDMISDKIKHDYRNSIKESISAVENICRLITKNQKTTLGQALKVVEEKIQIHGALRSAFDKLYGYTSDKDGIRHSLMDEPDIYYEDAKFMLVSCSAFINYLLQKATKAKIDLS